MKKYVKYLSLAVAVVLLSGCGKQVSNEKFVKTCNLTSNNAVDGYKLVSEYNAYGTGDVVDKVVTVETVSSDDEDVLDYFEEYLNETYGTLNETYGGYTFKVTKKDGKVISETTIDYSKMNLSKYVEDNSVMKSYVNSDNKLLVEGVLSAWKAIGATCEE